MVGKPVQYDELLVTVFICVIGGLLLIVSLGIYFENELTRLFFGGDTNSKRLFGMFLTFCGVVWYGHLKLTQASSKENWDQAKNVGGDEAAAKSEGDGAEVQMVSKA